MKASRLGEIVGKLGDGFVAQGDLGDGSRFCVFIHSVG
jgi:hypothetical protein